MYCNKERGLNQPSLFVYKCVFQKIITAQPLFISETKYANKKTNKEF